MRTIGQTTLLSIFALLLAVTTASAQKQWVPLGAPGFSPGVSAYTSLALDNSGTPYVAYLDASVGGKATVMKYNGTSWVTVGNQGFSSGTIDYPSLAFDNTGTLYIAYPATVMKFDGTSWVAVGSSFLSSQARMVTLAFDNNNTPYVSYQDVSNGLKAAVKKFDGANWVSVGGSVLSPGGTDYVHMAIDNNTPYVAFKDYANTYKASVMKFNGTSWVNVGTAGFSAGQAEYTTIAINNGTPYLSFQDVSQNQKATVMKFNGTSWVLVGNAGFSPGFVDNNLLAFDNSNTPYVMYKDQVNGSKATVMKYDGTNWVPFGSQGFSTSGYFYPSFVIDQSTNVPYVSYTDFVNNQAVTVMTWDCPAQSKAPAICAVLTDTVTKKNVIIWGGNTPHADSFRIYRENNGNFIHIGSVPGSDKSFTDPTANPAQQSYAYKLTVLDSCARESHIDSSVAHSTVSLDFNYLLGGKVSITFNAYKGLPNLTYVVKRKNNNGPFTTIASFGIAGNDTTYIDNTPPAGNNSYRVEIPLVTSCSIGGTTYGAITSNFEAAWPTGIRGLASHDILLAPNPADNKLTLSTTEAVEKIEVFGLTGKKLISEKGNGKKESVIDVSILPPGMYFLRVNGMNNTSFIKR